MNSTDKQDRYILQRIARKVMLEKSLLPEFSGDALSELDKILAPVTIDSEQTRDLRNLLWASIDNDDSRDLDQLTVAETMSGDEVKVLVAVADVDSIVKSKSAIDAHAQHNTTSVYTAARYFRCFPKNFHQPHIIEF